MTDQDYPELDDKQIELAKSFNAVAQKFYDLLLDDEQLMAWNKSYGAGQTNSYMATQAVKELSDYANYGGEHPLLNAVKRAGSFYTVQIIGTSRRSTKEQFAEECKRNIIKELLIDAFDQESLPVDAFRHPELGYQVHPFEP